MYATWVLADMVVPDLEISWKSEREVVCGGGGGCKEMKKVTGDKSWLHGTNTREGFGWGDE